MLWLSIMVSSLEGMKPSLYRQQGSLFRWVGAFCIREVDYIFILPDMGVTYPFYSPHFCLALPTMTQFCDWSHSSWGSLSVSINRHGCHSPCLTYVFLPRSAAHITLPVVFTHPQWRLQKTSMAEAATSCFSTPGKLYW